MSHNISSSEQAMNEVYVVEEEFFRLWQYDIEYIDEPRDVKYLRASDACLSFETEIYTAKVKAEDTFANLIKEAIGEFPRLYLMEEARAQLEKEYEFIADLEDIQARRYKRRDKPLEGVPTSVDGIFTVIVRMIKNTPNLSLKIQREMVLPDRHLYRDLTLQMGRHFSRHPVECSNEDKIAKYNVTDGDVLLLTRTSIWQIVHQAISEYFVIGGPLYRLRPIRHHDDFLSQVLRKAQVVKTKGKSLSKRPDYPHVLLLYTDEDPHVASYVRTHFDELDKASGGNCDVFFIENPSAINPVRYWKQFLEAKAYAVWKLLGWAETVPYDKAQAYNIADQLGIAFNKLPCAITFKKRSGKPQEVIPLGNNLTETFRKLFASYQSASSSIPNSRAYRKLQKTVSDYQSDTVQVEKPLCFLSHNSKDKATVREVASTLHSYGIETWFDEWEILPGDRILQNIADGLSKASAIVIFLSPDAAASKWVNQEVQNALYQSITTNKPRIVPVLLAECDIPLLIANYRRIEVGNSPPAIASAIRNAIKGITNKPPLGS